MCRHQTGRLQPHHHCWSTILNRDIPYLSYSREHRARLHRCHHRRRGCPGDNREENHNPRVSPHLHQGHKNCSPHRVHRRSSLHRDRHYRYIHQRKMHLHYMWYPNHPRRRHRDSRLRDYHHRIHRYPGCLPPGRGRCHLRKTSSKSPFHSPPPLHINRHRLHI